MATMAAVLSEDNRALLHIIRDARPMTLTELPALSGRQVQSVAHAADDGGLGLVELKRNVREIEPITLAAEVSRRARLMWRWI